MPTTARIQLQERDFELLRGFVDSPVMALRHIAAMYFDDRKEAAKKRVQRLKAAGFIRERPRAPQEPSVLSMTKKAFEALRHEGMLDGYPTIGWAAMDKRGRVSDLTLRHELEVVDVKAAFYRAVRRRPSLQIAEFSTWPRLNQFNAFHTATGERVTVKPDGFIRLAQTTAAGVMQHLFFLEVDRSTEALEIILNRAFCYRQYYKSGKFAGRLGCNPTAHRTLPFRVLIVCNGELRRRIIADGLLTMTPPVRTMAWLSTVHAVLRDSFGPIWRPPAATTMSLLQCC